MMNIAAAAVEVVVLGVLALVLDWRLALWFVLAVSCVGFGGRHVCYCDRVFCEFCSAVVVVATAVGGF